MISPFLEATLGLDEVLGFGLEAFFHCAKPLVLGEELV
jgi:hypothetical protein